MINQHAKFGCEKFNNMINAISRDSGSLTLNMETAV